MDLDVLVKPCPRGSPFRLEVEDLGGKAQFPFLVDSETGVSMSESDDIIAYLASTYGGGVGVDEVSERGNPAVSLASGLLASGLRGFRGGALSARARSVRSTYKPLELYSYENNQFCRPVRELLCELALPYRVKSAGKGSPRREELAGVAETTQCPFLVDPNTGVSLGESADILAYLEQTYSQTPKSKQSLPAGGNKEQRERDGLKRQIVALAAESKGGIVTSKAGDMEVLLEAFEKLNPTSKPAASPLLSGTWDLLWTTEDEILFAREKGLFLDGPCSRVTQTISTADGRLGNRIEFEGGGLLSVDSSLSPNPNEDGFSFAFDACTFGWRKSLRVPLPPVGKGEFLVTYLDADLRVQRDVTRGDTSVLRLLG